MEKRFIKTYTQGGFADNCMQIWVDRKTGVNYLENNNMLVSKVMNEQPAFKDFNRFVVDEDELYAINSMNINGTVLVPEGFPKTLKIVEDLGYPTKVVSTDEFRKIDGSLTCLSLRF